MKRELAARKLLTGGLSITHHGGELFLLRGRKKRRLVDLAQVNLKVGVYSDGSALPTGVSSRRFSVQRGPARPAEPARHARLKARGWLVAILAGGGVISCCRTLFAGLRVGHVTGR